MCIFTAKFSTLIVFICIMIMYEGKYVYIYSFDSDSLFLCTHGCWAPALSHMRSR